MTVTAGGTPSKGTPKDRRLKENKPKAVASDDGKPIDRFLGHRLYTAARMARWQAQLEQAAGRALATRRKRALTAVRSPLGIAAAAVPVDPFEEDTWGQAVESEITPVIQGIMAEIQADTAAMVGKDAVGRLPALDLTARVKQLADWYEKLGPETADALQKALQEGANLGESIPQLAARVGDVFDMSSRRATLIARTETSAMANGVQMDYARAIQSSGMQLQKSWLAGSCDICQGNEDDGPIGIDETFSSGDDASPAHPGCVCAIAIEPVDGEDVATEEAPAEA